MVFSSIPAYLDPANWQQQHHHHQTGSSSANTHDLLPPPPPPSAPQQPPPPPPHPHVGSGPSSIRPGSMADRARMANLPLPETALKCPRCESTNTKFCYFNNYSLTQPRHFCKTCRRYWTRGGALRNVPVGGGCRRNKRSKGSSSSSKSPVSSGDHQTGSGTSNSATPSNNSTSTTADILGLGPQIPPLRFMAPLHHLTHDHYGAADQMGLNYSTGNFASQMAATGDINFLIGSSSSGGAGGGSFLGIEPWRVTPPGQQFPFFAGLDPATAPGLYPVEGGYSGPKGSGFSGVSQVAPVKMEENQEVNLLSRQFLGINNNNNNNPGNDQYWSGTTPAWTDLSGFGSSSSTSHHL